MPWMVKDGGRQFVDNEDISFARGNGWEPEDPDVKVSVSGPGTAAVDVPFDRAVDLQSSAFSPESQQAYTARGEESYLQKEYGGWNATALAEAALSGTTGGLSDVAFSAYDPVGTREMRKRAIGTTAATVVGAAAPALLTGGTGTIASLARMTPAGLAARAGTSIAARGGLAATALGFGAEGMIQGAGVGVSNVALSEDPVNAETLLSEIGGNAVYGGLLGAGAGVLAHGAGVALKGLKNITAQSMARRAGQNVDVMLERAAGSGARDAAFESVDDMIDLASTPIPPEVQVSLKAKQSIQHTDELIARAKFLYDDAASTASGLDDAARARWSNLKKATAEFDHLLGDRTDDAIQSAFVKTGARLEASATKVENAVMDVFTDGKGAGKGIGTLFDGKIDDLSKIVKEARETAGANFKLGVDASKAGLGLTPGSEGLRQVEFSNGKVIPGVLDAPVDGRTVGAKLGKAKGNMPWALGSVLSLAADFIPGAHTIGRLGRVLGTLGVVEKAIGTGVGALDMAIGGLLKTSKVASRVTVPATTQILSNAVFSSKPKAAKSKKARDVFMQRAEEVREFESNPDAKREEINQSLLPVHTADPVLAEQVAQNAITRMAHIAATMPRSPGIGNTLQAKDRWLPSDDEMQKWARTIWITEKQENVVTAMRSGTLTYNDVQDVKAVMPATYEKIRVGIVERIPELRAEMPYDQRIQLSVFFDVPVDTMMTPERIHFSQETHATAKDGEGGKTATQETGKRGGLASMNAANVGKQELTTGQKLAAR